MEIPISNNTEEFEEKVTEKTTENNENNKVKEKLTKKDIKEKNDTCEEKKTKDDLLKEYKEQLQRVQAEFINYRKRIENERKRDFLIAKGSMISSILPVLDDFDRMFEHYKGKKQCNLEEIKMIYNNLKRILEEQELTEIDDKGKEFDPNCHEAIGVIDTCFENDDVVMEVLQKGYRFGDKLLRPSRVRVGKYKEVIKKSQER